VNLLRENVDTIKRYRGTLFDAINKIGLEVNMEETKHVLVFVSRHQSAVQNHDIETVNRLFLGEICHNSNIWKRQ
jgi:hypothetical protein